jgi:ATP-dependent Clp protease, protease subunit
MILEDVKNILMGILIMKKFRILILILLFSIFTITTLYASNYVYCTDLNNVKTYDVFIDQEVFQPAVYRDLILCLQYAQKEDVFIFHINTDGGSLFSAIEIYNSIKKTKAYTIADLYKGFSAGALITIACKKVILNDFAIMMIHNFSLGMSGNISDIKVESDFSKNLNDFIINIAFADFLSKKEIKEVTEGKTLWLTEDQLFIKFGKINKLNLK